MGETIHSMGGWFYVITLWGLVFFGMIAYQFVKGDKWNGTRLLWGMFVSLLLIGPLGSLVGLREAFMAVEPTAATPAVLMGKAVFKGIAIASTTTIYSTLIAVLGALFVGFATHRSSRGSRQPGFSGESSRIQVERLPAAR